MVNKILDFLNQPFPSTYDLKSQFSKAAAVGFFVFLFLFLIRPFGTDRIDLSLVLWHTLLFGLITFLVTLVYDPILQKVFGFEFDKPNWTFGKWLLSTIGLILMISIANFLTNTFVLGYAGFEWTAFLGQMYATFIVGVFPIVFFGTITLMRNEKKYVKVAGEIELHDSTLSSSLSEESTIVVINSDQESLELKANDILYVEALQNYVMIHQQDADTITLRSTLKAIEEQLSPYDIIRTHRSYLVNHDKIEKVAGNAQGLKLSLEGTDSIVPVSRSYIATVKAIL